MSAGTSVSGGIGGIFYVLLLMYGLVTRIYERKNDSEKSSKMNRRCFARVLPMLAIATVMIVVILNLENFGVIHSSDASSILQIMISQIQGAFTNHAIIFTAKYLLLPLLNDDGLRVVHVTTFTTTNYWQLNDWQQQLLLS
jgi:hypothetical protein